MQLSPLAFIALDCWSLHRLALMNHIILGDALAQIHWFMLLLRSDLLFGIGGLHYQVVVDTTHIVNVLIIVICIIVLIMIGRDAASSCECVVALDLDFISEWEILTVKHALSHESTTLVSLLLQPTTRDNPRRIGRIPFLLKAFHIKFILHNII